MKVKETSPAFRTEKKYTYDDYLQLIEDGKRYEVIHGELIMTPALFTIHQRTSLNIVELLLQFIKKNKVGEVLFAPVDVVLSDDNVVQPDILFVAKDRAHIITERNVSEAPDLVVEILSPATAYYDLVEKKELYEAFGVKEYWLVDPKKHSVEVYFKEAGKFKLLKRWEREGVLRSTLLQGLQVELAKIFA
ncbi:MAG: Uma2 family endonuclease [bacterium]